MSSAVTQIPTRKTCGECQRVVVPTRLLLQVVHEVANLRPASVEVFVLDRCSFVAVEQDLLALVVESVGLHQVDDVELVVEAFAHVADGEKEPLRVFVREVVVVDHQVVLERSAAVTPSYT